VDAERPLALRQVDHANDLAGDLLRVRVIRGQLGEARGDLVHQPGVALLVLGGDVGVLRVAGVGEVVGPVRERARHDDRRVDTEPRQFGGVADRQRVHRRLRGEVRRQVRRRAAARARRADPHEEPVALRAQRRQDGAVDALGREHVRGVGGRELHGRERLGRAEHHVPGVVDHDIEPVGVAHDRADAPLDRRVVRHVELNGPQVDAVLPRVGGGVRGGRLVPAADVAHAGVHGVAGVREGAGGHRAEAARRAGDDDLSCS
jgi:hypothetical protein